jgi:hypothetical protein
LARSEALDGRQFGVAALPLDQHTQCLFIHPNPRRSIRVVDGGLMVSPPPMM